MTTPKAIPHTQRALEELRALIFSGALPPGSDHLETELATRLNMSRTPVREAALILSSQGLLELRPRKGVRILPISATDMREIYDVLTELESLAAERAATSGHPHSALAALTTATEDMETALAAEDRLAWAKADDDFHRELVHLGDNARVAHIVAMMSDQVRRARAVTLFIRPTPSQSNADHRGVLNAIRDGDAQAARRIHRAHRQQARDMIVGLLEQHHLHMV